MTDKTPPIKGFHALGNIPPTKSSLLIHAFEDAFKSANLGTPPSHPFQRTHDSCIDYTGDKWEIYQDIRGHWRWRRTAPNGRIVGASTEGYVNKSDCEENAKRLRVACIIRPRISHT